MARILVTGADGFIGRTLTGRLQARGEEPVSVARTASGSCDVGIGDIGAYEGWPALLHGVDVIVHLAARAHVTDDRVADPLSEFRRINTEGTLRLARAAVEAGVRRFVFVSSIGVNGTSSDSHAFVESDPPHAREPYAISKWEAEQGLMEIGTRTGLEIVRVRPPLVIGPGAKGNLRRLMKLVRSGMPLLLGAIENERSFLVLDDLCELLILCSLHPRASGELFLAANLETISTPDLMREMASGLGRRAHLLPVPLPLLRLVTRLTGTSALLERMASSLRVNSERAHRLLGWSPACNVREHIRVMARYYLREENR